MKNETPEAKTHLSWAATTGIANRTYIPENAKRLEAKFGNRRDVADPIREEIERAYAQGYWDALQAAERRIGELSPDGGTQT